MSLSARVYVKLEDEIAKTGDRAKSDTALKVLWRVIKQPKVLKGMTNFIEVRNQFATQNHSGTHKLPESGDIFQFTDPRGGGK